MGPFGGNLLRLWVEIPRRARSALLIGPPCVFRDEQRNLALSRVALEHEGRDQVRELTKSLADAAVKGHPADDSAFDAIGVVAELIGAVG